MAAMSLSTLAPCPTDSPQAQPLLDQIEALADVGLFLQAHTLATQLGDYRHWQGPRAITLAARLASRLGAQRLARVLTYLGYRRYPHAAETRLGYARYLHAQQGHYRAWRFVQQFAGWLPEAAGQRADWLSFQAYLYATLRDFGRSAQLQAQVSECGVEDPWLLVEHSYALEAEDRYAEALALCETALRICPHYRSAVVQAVQLQQQLNQDEQALERLRNAAEHMESAAVCAQLAEWLIEREQLDEALQWLERSERLLPLEEKGKHDWYAARRCDIACLRGDYAQALSLAERLDWPFYTLIRERLAAPQGKRLLLPVSFVRQHHMTCVPATLTALSAYWGRTVAHLEVAEDICYDGTAYQAERAWAERNGWHVAEFTVDWDTSRALIDRGLPFTLSLQYTGSGHLQAVVGYDEPRGSLLIRDPGQAHFGECLAAELLMSQQPSGPRGMLLVPPEHAHRLDGLQLPDKPLWDLYYQVTTALETHCRDDAMAALQQLRERAPDHRLAWQAQRALAWYDGREHQVLEATEVLLERFAGDANLIISKAVSLAQLQSREVQLNWLASHCQARWNEPVITVRYAELLSSDERMNAQMQTLLERALRQAPTQAQAWNVLASLRWTEGLREEACELYRLAACLHGSQENYSSQYFRALRSLGRSEEGVLFLQERQRRLGRLDAGPTLTLCEFLEELQRPFEVRALLEQAIAQRPQDAYLMLALADFCGRNGDFQANHHWLLQAEPHSRRSSWLRAAVLHSQRSDGDVREALAWCQEATQMEPLNLSLHRMYVRLLVQTAGDTAADAYVDELASTHPHHLGIAELAYERAQRRSLPDAEEVLRRLLASHPQSAWATRELAIGLARQGKRSEALQVCEQAREIEPHESYTYSSLGFVLLQDGQRDAAAEAFRTALRLSADNDYASDMLLDISASQDAARQSLSVVHDELVRQVTFGNGWYNYALQGKRLLEPSVLMDQLGEALQRRADLWQLWVAVARQHAAMEHFDKADSVMQAAIERFPLLPRLALEAAQLQKAQGLLSECQATLSESFKISPLWTSTVSLYVDCLLEQGDRLPEAEQLLRSVLARSPDDTELRAYLAYVLGEQEIYVYAADEAERVLRAEPGNNWAWRQLNRYSAALKEPQRPLNLARELVVRRVGDVDAWLALAEQEEGAQKEQALREALRFSPRHRKVNDQLAELLLQEARHEHLRELLAAPCWGGALPVELALFEPKSLYAAGDSEAAVKALFQLLTLHPDYYGGWRQLADWHDHGGNYKAYVNAAREMVRIEPKTPISHGYLGHALLLDGQPAAALPCFSRAYSLDAEYVFAGANEIDLHLQLGSHDAAREVLERLLANCQEPSAWTRALRVANAVHDTELQRRAWQALATDPNAQDHWRELPGTASPVDKVLQPILAQGIEEGTLHAGAIGTWLREQDARKWPGSLGRAFDKALRNDPDNMAKSAMLRLLANRENCNHLLHKALQASHAAMASDGHLWGMVGYALVNHRRYEAMFAWMNDWQREDTPAWGLNNLALAMRTRRRDEEAAAVSRLALQREARNMDAMLWLAIDAAYGERMDELESWLEQIQADELQSFYKAFWHLLQGYVHALKDGDSDRARTYFYAARAAAKGENHPTFRRLLTTLSKRLAFSALTPKWQQLNRYLQLRY
jgi:tetratricopeptide (TPR) repeat protein